MDGNDRKELSALGELEKAREEYLKKHGSFLYCEQRDTLCVYMDGMWMTGCERESCILDDPEYQLLQERIEKNRRRQAEDHAENRKKEKEDALISNRRGRPRSIRDRKMKEIHRLEEASQEAFRQNKPNLGESLFVKARFMRGELKKEEEEWKRRAQGSAG